MKIISFWLYTTIRELTTIFYADQSFLLAKGQALNLSYLFRSTSTGKDLNCLPLPNNFHQITLHSVQAAMNLHYCAKRGGAGVIRNIVFQ